MESGLSVSNGETKVETRVVGARIRRERGKAASMAREAATGTLDRLG